MTPAARGRGVGGALLRYLAGIAVERNCARFEWAVLDWNVDAIAVYRRMGAVGLEDWTVQRVEGEALRRMAGPDSCPGGEGRRAAHEGWWGE